MRCEECGTVAVGDARGWWAMHATDPGGQQPIEVATFCPDCAARAFGVDLRLGPSRAVCQAWCYGFADPGMIDRPRGKGKGRHGE
jgi:hypothetical protein